MRRLKKSIKIALLLAGILFLVIVLSNYAIEKNAKNKVFETVESTPKNKVGLVLGTVKRLQNGQINLYYTYRIKATVSLYTAGKIRYIIVSGDNSTSSYDEPTDFKNDLVAAGIPEDKIFLDYAGFRTLDSVVRVKEIFGQDSVTIISQEFHNERAIYLAENFDINAVGFNAKNVSGRYGLKVQLREYLARTKVFVDILFNVQPKFLGEKIEIK